MITIGLAGFTDHPELLGRGEGLAEYAQTFPVIEIDSTAYGIRKQAVIQNWVNQVPPTFKFIIKASRLMTRHQQANRATLIQEFALFEDGLEPMIDRGQLATVLFQFPPYFAANAANARYLARLRQWLPEIPIAVELRHGSWFAPEMRQATLDLLRDAKLQNVAVDEPQTPNNSVPFVPELTAGDTLFVRLHGRNQAGWLSGEHKERTNYTYTVEELQTIVAATEGKAPNTLFIFNNNGDHAAFQNACDLQLLLGVTFTGLAPKQLDLF